MVYVSNTGLKLERFWHIVPFMRHAIASIHQAKNAPGVIEASAKRIDGVFHTPSVWTNRTAMIDYLRSGAHQQAMKVFPRIATGIGFGYEAKMTDIPDWPSVHAQWLSRLETPDR